MYHFTCIINVLFQRICQVGLPMHRVHQVLKGHLKDLLAHPAQRHQDILGHLLDLMVPLLLGIQATMVHRCLAQVDLLAGHHDLWAREDPLGDHRWFPCPKDKVC